MNLEDRLKKFEADLAARAAEVERRADQKLAEVERRMGATLRDVAGPMQVQTPSGVRDARWAMPTPRAWRVDLSSANSLRVLDDVMEAEFEIQSYLGGTMADYPTTYCETVREYVTPILADFPMSDSAREDLIRSAEEQAEQGNLVLNLNSLGVHIPGVGCFINGWYFGKRMNVAPKNVLQTREGYAEVASTAAHEKWGHGFITELTAAGNEKKEVQLGMHHLADQFEIKTVDTPEHARLSEQWEILFHSSKYVEEGYATWVERYLIGKVAEKDGPDSLLTPSAPPYTAEAVITALSASSATHEAAVAMEGLFFPNDITMEGIHTAFQTLNVALEKADEAFTRACGMPAPYVIGSCICDRIARQQGAKCVPYAVATACNIQYGLATISNHDLRNYVNNQPTLNANSRLALMMYVSPGTSDDIRAFVVRTKEQLGIVPPFG